MAQMNTTLRTQNSQNQGITLAHALTGSPVSGVGGINHSEGNVQPAGLHSTAPYKPPKRRKRDNPERSLCSFDECKAYPMKSTGYCSGHSQNLGLAKWKNKGGRNKDGTYGDAG